MGLKVQVLKNVLTEAKGIKTRDLFPVIEDLHTIQRYLHDNIGIGSLIDLERFVDTRFAKVAYQNKAVAMHASPLQETAQIATEILQRGVVGETTGSEKAKLDRVGKYLSFRLAKEEFGIDILKVREIIGMMNIRKIPQTPEFIKGVINLRGKVIPVLDLRSRFGMEERDQSDRNCIVILGFGSSENALTVGVTVDSVSQVMDIKATDIQDPPFFGQNVDMHHLLGLSPVENRVRMLLDIDHVIDVSMFKKLDRTVAAS